MKSLPQTLLALVLAAAIWLPSMRFFFAPSRENVAPGHGISAHARQLANRQLRVWTDPASLNREIERMRASNAEWDFMGRSFLVWALAEMCLHNPALQARHLPVIDRIIEETLRLEAEHSFRFFLLPYANYKPFLATPAGSHFVDGEIALMLAARQSIERNSEWEPQLKARLAHLAERIEAAPILCPESYPDECWTFDQSIGLAALVLGDRLYGTNHRRLFERWLAMAKEQLIHRETGLLVSRFTYDGTIIEGPEGSSIWMIAHCLRLVDEEFARDQYDRARKEFGRVWLGFGFAREWPDSWQTPPDIDSGVIMPVLDASPAASGLAFIGAASFGDTGYLEALHTSLKFGGFPISSGDELRYAASNQVGDAAMLYACVLGPLWKTTTKEQRHEQ
ncbi:MAG TPA: hypothetical protein DCY13_08705 [Verrucomicrobiales bacterium]|nr:hypothetical protein [Verrucomicrobiales bacterium]